MTGVATPCRPQQESGFNGALNSRLRAGILQTNGGFYVRWLGLNYSGL